MLAQAQRGGGPPTMPPAPGSLPAHNSRRSTEGVYYATATGSMTTGSNVVVVVNDEDVLIVDPGITAGAATAFIADVKTLTNKPIKYVVDTHYHYDHAFGNQVFGPDVTIIGHDTARRRLSGPGSLKERTYLMNSTAAIATRFTLLKRQISEAKDAQERAIYERQLAIHQQYADEQPKIKPTPPNATLSRDMTLHRGSREIQIRFFGRAHTDGDIVVFLPKERMVATGDMITSALSYTGDAFVEEWPATLEAGDVAGLRHGPARARQRVQGQGSHPQPAGVLARFLSAGDGASKTGRAARGSGQENRPDEARGRDSRGENAWRRRARRRSHLRPRGESERACALGGSGGGRR